MKCEFIENDSGTFLVFENEDCAEIASKSIKYICFSSFGGYLNALKIA